MGGSSSYTAGYRYFMDLLMGIGRGAVDAVRKIRIGDRIAWQGERYTAGPFNPFTGQRIYTQVGGLSPVTDNESIIINAPNLFGGEDGGGGVLGRLDVMMGAPDQAVNTALQAAYGPLTPALRHVTTAFFQGQIAAVDPYPKPWEFQVTRILMGWDGENVWNAAKAVIEPDGLGLPAMNPAHILVQMWTDRGRGRGLPLARLDLDTFGAAADALHDEGFGMCLRWTRRGSINEAMQLVLDHIGGVQRRGPDGRIQLVLIRADYDPETIPLFTLGTGLSAIDEDIAAAGDRAVNEVIVAWRDPVDNQERQTRWQNLAAIHANNGDVISVTHEYPGIPTAGLASRVAERDGRALAPGIRRFKLRFDRRGDVIRRGDVFRISVPSRGIASMVLRAGPIEQAAMLDGEITIQAVQDVFGLPATTYVDDQPSGHQPPDHTPVPVSARQLFEPSYRDLAAQLSAADLAALAPESGMVAAVGGRPSSVALNYRLATRVGTNDFEEVGAGDWCPTGVLAAPIGADQVPTAVITLTSASDIELLPVGSPALLGAEVVRIDAVDPETLQVTVARGCADTVPVDHAVGARFWGAYDTWAASGTTEYVVSEVVQAKMLTRTSQGILDLDSAPTDSLTLQQRQARPYPPARVRVNGAAWPASVPVSEDLTVAWAHRDRVLQADQLVDTEQGSTGPEPGTTYTRIIEQPPGTVIDTETGITGTSATPYTWPTTGPARVRLFSVRDSLESWQEQVRDFEVV